jgi:hypothetical protein
MGRKERRGHGSPPLDPFGANDPAWERYYGVSWLKRVASSQRARPAGGVRREPRELLAALVVGVLALAVVVGAIALLFWGAASLVRLLN